MASLSKHLPGCSPGRDLLEEIREVLDSNIEARGGFAGRVTKGGDPPRFPQIRTCPL